MSIRNVGLGKLPNIYFEKITLEDYDDKSFKIITNIIIQDGLEDLNFIWSEDVLLSSFIRVALVSTSNIEMANELGSGTNLHPNRINKSDFWDDRTSVDIYGFKDFKMSEDTSQKRFRLDVATIKGFEVSDLFMFAFVFIDHKEMSNFLEISLTGPLSEYMGPVSSEQVLKSSEVPNSLKEFRDPFNEIYPGPVSQISGKWFSETNEGEDDIPLTLTLVKNSKILDMRSKDFMNHPSLDYESSTIISDASYSLNSDADLFGLFSINMRSLVLKETKFGKNIHGLDGKILSNIVNSVEINSAEIYRRQVKFRRQVNLLSSPFFVPEDVLPKRLIGTRNDLKELMVVDEPHIKTYTFSDLSMQEASRGEFIYEIDLTFIDRTQEFIERTLSSIKSNLENLKDMVRRLNSPNNYNDDLNQLREGEQIPADIAAFIDDYYEFSAILKNISALEASEMSKRKKAAFTTSSYRKSYGLNFISDYERLYVSMQNRFGVTPKELKEGATKFSHYSPPNIIKVSKTFDSTVRFSDVKSSYDVLGKSKNKEILMLERDEWISRVDREIERFFDTSKSLSSEDMFNIDNNDSEALRDLDTSKMLFLSPLSFKFKKEIINTESMADVNVEMISSRFIESKIESSEQTVSSKTRHRNLSSQIKANAKNRSKTRASFSKSKNSFDFKLVKGTERPAVLDGETSPAKLRDYYKENTLVNPLYTLFASGANLKGDAPKSSLKDIERNLIISKSLSVKRSKANFDLTKEGGFYEGFRFSKQYNPEKLRKMPVSIKSLFASRSRAAKNNIQESSSDIMKMAETKIPSEMIFHSNQKIQALHGFEKNNRGESILSSPIWTDLTENMLDQRSHILCKMSYAEDALVGIVPSTDFKLPILNSTFIIKGSGGSQSSSVIISDENETLSESKNVTYTTSNIVRQPRS